MAAPQAKVVVPSADAVHAERANAIFNKMVTLDIPRTEMTYTALARIEAATGEPRKALDIAKRLIDETAHTEAPYVRARASRVLY